MRGQTYVVVCKAIITHVVCVFVARLRGGFPLHTYARTHNAKDAEGLARPLSLINRCHFFPP